MTYLSLLREVWRDTRGDWRLGPTAIIWVLLAVPAVLGRSPLFWIAVYTLVGAVTTGHEVARWDRTRPDAIALGILTGVAWPIYWPARLSDVYFTRNL